MMREGENEVGDVRLRRNGLSDSGKKVGGSIWFVLFVTAAFDVCFNEESTIWFSMYSISQKCVDLSLKEVP